MPGLWRRSASTIIQISYLIYLPRSWRFWSNGTNTLSWRAYKACSQSWSIMNSTQRTIGTLNLRKLWRLVFRFWESWSGRWCRTRATMMLCTCFTWCAKSFISATTSRHANTWPRGPTWLLGCSFSRPFLTCRCPKISKPWHRTLMRSIEGTKQCSGSSKPPSPSWHTNYSLILIRWSAKSTWSLLPKCFRRPLPCLCWNHTCNCCCNAKTASWVQNAYAT